MTVKITFTEEEKRRAERLARGVWPGPLGTKKPGEKGVEEAQRRFGKQG